MPSPIPAAFISPNILTRIAGVAAVGLAALAVLGFARWNALGPSVLLMLAMASLLVGSFLGLLFGTPERKDVEGAKPGDRLNFRSSDNLKQISDWLTKIIVGVTLTQFQTIVGYLDSAAGLAANAFGDGTTSPNWGKSVGFSLMLLHGAAGFWYGYLWAVSELPGILDRSELRRRQEEEKRELAVGEQGGTVQSRVATKTQLAALPDGEIEKGPNPDDPWKGAFGGSNKVDGWSLTARVEPLANNDRFRVILQCRGKQTPESGAMVKFFLHPTFRKPVQLIPVGANGIAELRLIAWGAFTVGAVTPDGQKLELDLSTLDAPTAFTER